MLHIVESVGVSECRPEGQCGDQLTSGPESSSKGNGWMLSVVLLEIVVRAMWWGQVCPWRPIVSDLTAGILIGGHQNTASQCPHLRAVGVSG